MKQKTVLQNICARHPDGAESVAGAWMRLKTRYKYFKTVFVISLGEQPRVRNRVCVGSGTIILINNNYRRSDSSSIFARIGSCGRKDNTRCSLSKSTDPLHNVSRETFEGFDSDSGREDFVSNSLLACRTS